MATGPGLRAVWAEPRAAVRRRAVRYRDHRGAVALEVVRAVSALFSVVSLSTAALPSSVSSPAVAAHLAVFAVSGIVVAALPAAVRAGHDAALGATMTAATVLFYIGATALWHDVPGAGTALGVMALLEAPIRYGWKGAGLSAFPVLWTALLLPQVDVAGRTLPDGVVVTLVVLLLAAALAVRSVMRRSEAAVTGAAQGFADAMLHLPLGVAVLDEDGHVLHANPALDALLGPTAGGVRLGGRLRAFAGEDDALAAALAGTAPDDRVLCRTRDGRELALGAATVHVPGPRRTVVHLQDVTDERAERADLLHASRHDALTGLLTRAAGTELLTEALAATDPAAVLFLDLDGFKRLNDTAGHAVGDVVLRQVAGRLSRALRPSERAVRWGGDEFVVVCSEVDTAVALQAVAERLLAVLREPFRVPELPLLTLTASIGGLRALPGSLVPAVLDAADAAMYEAKRAGGDRWVAAPTAAAAPAGPVLGLDLRDRCPVSAT
ncbi:MAG TPA: sensor domain-containing diguanylate cyclase [Mycobacteriales bacterium]|nr:sensor domain-containing diguanylate cyclase [Mycobacteriales bacterium]